MRILSIKEFKVILGLIILLRPLGYPPLEVLSLRMRRSLLIVTSRCALAKVDSWLPRYETTHVLFFDFKIFYLDFR